FHSPTTLVIASSVLSTPSAVAENSELAAKWSINSTAPESTISRPLPFSETHFSQSGSPSSTHPSIGIMNERSHRSEPNSKHGFGLSSSKNGQSTGGSTSCPNFLTVHSIEQLLSADLFDDIRALLRRSRLPPNDDDDRYRGEPKRFHWTCFPSRQVFSTDDNSNDESYPLGRSVAQLLDIFGGRKNETAHFCFTATA